MKPFLIPALVAAGATVVALLAMKPLAPLEDQMTALKYSVRGSQRADTNIVVVYVDNDAIKELGWPVRRNFYALMINALAELKAKAVGIDVVFENPNLEYPEYDQLLAHIIRGAHNVALSAYFETVGDDSRDGMQSSFAGDTARVFDFPLVADVSRFGSGLHLPMPELLSAAAGIGHANVGNDGLIALFMTDGPLVVPSFGAELLRLYCGDERNTVRFERNVFALRKEGSLLSFPADNGRVQLNYPGRMTSFTLFPFLEVLKSYDALRAGRTPLIPVENFRNKLILIGVIAGGRSETFSTPVDPRLPSIGLHATFLDNALRSGFLRPLPVWQLAVLCLVAGFICTWSVFRFASAARWYVPALLIVAAGVLSVWVFVLTPLLIPTVPPALAGILATGGAFFYRHLTIRKELQIALSEKERIVASLRDREAKVAALERELVAVEKTRTPDRTQELLEEIHRYKAEIRDLNSRKDDMEEALVTADVSAVKTFEGIVYESGGALQPAIDFIAKIADSDATVLILGESGTGKEMVARAIHRRSRRSSGPFVAVNCGALAENLLESELFGHEKGAFTGAVKDRPGRFELADGGTIFLDEIGEVTEAFQLKLLRVLQEGEFERVGGTKTMKVSVRVIAATNKDLKQQVREKRFREDVYYRLNVLSVELPPLRERRGDIPLLVNHFLNKEGNGVNVSKNVLDTLQNYSWQGNIRELESAITRAVLLARADKRMMITMKDLSGEIVSGTKGSLAIEDQILESLREKGFSRSAITETADELGGLNRGTVAEYLRGQCLKAFVEHTYNLDTTIRYISLSSDAAVNERVRRKIIEYLSNIAEAVSPDQPWDLIQPALKSKTKNLPQKYHAYLGQVAEAYYRRVWKQE